MAVIAAMALPCLPDGASLEATVNAVTTNTPVLRANITRDPIRNPYPGKIKVMTLPITKTPSAYSSSFLRSMRLIRYFYISKNIEIKTKKLLKQIGRILLRQFAVHTVVDECSIFTLIQQTAICQLLQMMRQR